MTPEQVALVQNSFKQVEPISDTAADLFYGRLFEIEPSVRPLFPDDMSEQKKKLMSTLAFVVKSLDQPESILPAVRALGQRHINYGVTDDQYAPVGAALLWTLEQGLGKTWNEEVKEAWTEAYTLLANVMTEAAGEVTPA